MFSSSSHSNSKYNCQLLCGIVFAILLTVPFMAQAKTVVISTPLGDIELELLEDDAPNTVANFLRYIDSNRYENSFIHRSVRGFIIQGGGFVFTDGTVSNIPTFDQVTNEFKNSNTRGTVAMAKLGGQPDSATSQWFINLDDNSHLDSEANGAFTVFARVTGNGMAVADAISRLPTTNQGGALTDLPVHDFTSGTITDEHLVMTDVKEIVEIPPFVINAGLNDAWYNPDTDGQGFFITVFPAAGVVALAWFTYDTELPPQDASANLGDPGHRWITAAGPINGDSAVLEIEVASGGLFDDPRPVTRDSDGTITLSFDNCNSGTIDYDITSINRRGSVPIRRIASDNISLCEALLETETNR